MLPKAQRLRRREVALLMKKGSVQKTGLFFLRVFEDKLHPDSPARFAIILPKKSYNTIVERNTLRREIYKKIQEQITSFPTGKWYGVSPLKTTSQKIKP